MGESAGIKLMRACKGFKNAELVVNHGAGIDM